MEFERRIAEQDDMDEFLRGICDIEERINIYKNQLKKLDYDGRSMFEVVTDPSTSDKTKKRIINFVCGDYRRWTNEAGIAYTPPYNPTEEDCELCISELR